MISAKLTYHFEDGRTPEELDAKTAQLALAGWSTKGAPRPVELSIAGRGKLLRFCQAYVRPLLLPVCERARVALPAGLASLGQPLPPQEHLVHFYEEDRLLLNSLEAFVLQGLLGDEAVVVIALPEHRSALEFRLRRHELDLGELEGSRQLVLLDAASTLASFLHDGMPSEVLFEEQLGGLLAKLRTRYRTVRAFGEMVGLLWQDGNRAATVRLEELWHAYCQREDLVLYCAYRRSAFATEAESLRQICACHTQVLEA